MSTSDDYYTPPEVFDALQLKFDLDVSAPKGGVPWIPAKHHYCLEDDALQQPWFGRVWMNPPFSNSAPFVERFLAHNHGVAILPTSRAKWFGKLWQSNAAFVHPVTKPMFQFIRDDKRTHIFMPVMFVALGDDCIAALHAIGKVR